MAFSLRSILMGGKLFATAALIVSLLLGVAALAAEPTVRPATYPAMKIERPWITMPDGVRLATTLYLPDGAKPSEKFPVILEYLPYRKDDWSLGRDFALHQFFARRGYVAARVDIRGTGQSEGHPPDREYSEQEQLDGEQVIAWLARQPWSNGSVGMMGISWGGFNSIQMAMRRPPALKAIIAVDATDWLFHEDVHYMDGMMHADEFEIGMDLELAEVRAPDFPLDEETLKARFDSEPWFLLYLKHQREDAFWAPSTLRPNYDRINIPTFLIGGFYDGYRDSIPRMLEHMKVPMKAIVGPWNHTFPHDAEPGPAIEWRELAMRWWDRWLKGEPNGIENQPRLDVYMRHYYPPGLSLKEIPGEWRSEPQWPAPEIKPKKLYLRTDHILADKPSRAGVHQLKYVPSIGSEAGFWWGELTADQRPIDAFSLTYDSAPLKEETAILGLPSVILHASASAPLANWFVRLSDVAPDGSTTLVTGAGLSGAQRDSFSDPKPLEPGVFYKLEIPMHFTSWVFPPGHRIRLAVNNALWPMIWPTPWPMTTSLKLGGNEAAVLTLPTVPAHSTAQPSFPAPVPAEPLPGYSSSGEEWPGQFRVLRDMANTTTGVEWRSTSETTFPWGSENNREQLIYQVKDEDPAKNKVHGEADFSVELKDRTVVWKTWLDLSSDEKNMYYKYKRQLLQDDKIIREKEWSETIPRDNH